jgi:hypothetical protein
MLPREGASYVGSNNHSPHNRVRGVQCLRLFVVRDAGSARPFEKLTMGENQEHRKELCQQAATNQDTRKLLELTRRIKAFLLLEANRLNAGALEPLVEPADMHTRQQLVDDTTRAD